MEGASEPESRTARQRLFQDTNNSQRSVEMWTEGAAQALELFGGHQQQVADQTGVSRRMIAHYETQAVAPPISVLPKIAAVLGVSVDEMLGVVKSQSAADATPRSAAELRLWRRLQQIQRLPAHKRKAVIQVLDGFLAGMEESG